jgi:hypothetical protein
MSDLGAIAFILGVPRALRIDQAEPTILRLRP